MKPAQVILFVLAGFGVLVVTQHLCCFLKHHYGLNLHTPTDELLTWLRPDSVFQQERERKLEANGTTFSLGEASAKFEGAQQQLNQTEAKEEKIEEQQQPSVEQSMRRRLQETESEVVPRVANPKGDDEMDEAALSRLRGVITSLGSGRRRRRGFSVQTLSRRPTFPSHPDAAEVKEKKRTTWDEDGNEQEDNGAWTVDTALPPSPSYLEDPWDASRRRKPQVTPDATMTTSDNSTQPTGEEKEAKVAAESDFAV